MTVPASLAGKVALVTGAGRRVGRAVAERLVHEGMSVVLHCHGSRDGAEAVARQAVERGQRAAVVQADLRRAEGRERVRDAALAFGGGLHLVVAGAANFDRVPFDAWTDEHWARAMELNLEAPVKLARDLAARLSEARGSVVFITDAGALRPHTNYFPYLVSKGALAYAMRAMALELAPRVRVNAVAPGIVLAPEELSAEEKSALVRTVPLGTEGGAEVVADAVVYLARAEFVTGAELVVDGGRWLTA